MTWSEVLRLACEEVGMEHSLPNPSLQDYGPFDGFDCWIVAGLGYEHYLMGTDHPALPAYVAELLMAKVANQKLCGDIYDNVLPTLSRTKHEWSLKYSPAKTRILAAMVALGKLTLEQAQEVER